MAARQSGVYIILKKVLWEEGHVHEHTAGHTDLVQDLPSLVACNVHLAFTTLYSLLSFLPQSSLGFLW
jgi:hypothetical protein